MLYRVEEAVVHIDHNSASHDVGCVCAENVPLIRKSAHFLV
jgi:hypothetical protein